MKVPNILTLSRLVLAPVFIGFFMADGHGASIAALALAIFFELSDFLDGRLARRLHQVTEFGKVIDPLADSICHLTVFLCFLATGMASVWVIAVLVWRESMVGTLRILAARGNVVLQARWSGKIKAASQGGLIMVILFLRAFGESLGLGFGPYGLKDLAWDMTIGIAVISAASFVDYVWANRRFLRGIAE